jgi:UDP-N-acetylglucosamine 4,6-dehydratase
MNILITGGTGSLGTALVKRLYGTCNITILSRDEAKQGKMKANFPECTYVIGDVANYEDIELAFKDIDVVYHFAAYKQVPSAQNNVMSTIKTNVYGSWNVAKASIKAGVAQVVASSTDKACQPVNLYGVSKSAMESIFQDANKYSDTTFHLARYGNVICSSASVIPLFQRQAAQGGPLTVTHAEMTRFWISIETALDLIQHALTAPPGVIVVPAADAMEIVEVAEAIGKGLAIEEIGIRPGEKIHEYMVSKAESFHTEIIFDFDDVKDIGVLYYIYPPTAQFRNNDAPFEYRSDLCQGMREQELLAIVEAYEH